MKENKRASLLISNIVVYGFNQVIVVLIPMIMLPIYSRILPDISVYGISSLATTVCTLASSIATFGMFDAAVRFAFDNNENRIQHHKEICSTATFFMLISSIVVAMILILFREYVSKLFYGTSQYGFIIIIAAGMAIFTVWNTAALIPIRIYNKKRLALANSMIKAIVTACTTLLLILAKDYLISIPMGTSTGLVFAWMFTFVVIQRKYLSLKCFRLDKMYEMLKYAAPLMITFVSYWIYQSADRIMLSWLADLREVGIYAIGAKVAALSAVIQNAFASGWAYFAFSTMNDEDQIQLISRIFRIGSVLCCMCGAFATAFVFPVFQLMFAKGDYIEGAFLCPTLLTAPLFLTLMQVVGTQLLIKKNTRFYSLVQIFGALSNIVLNVLLIPIFKSRGAAVGTLIGYAVPLFIMACLLVRGNKIIISKSTIMILVSTIIALLISTLFFSSSMSYIIIGLINILLISFLAKTEIRAIMLITISKLKTIKKGEKNNDNAQ